MNKHILFLPLLLIGLILWGCSGLPKGVATSPIELKVSTWGPPELPISRVNAEWAQRIEQASGGRVKFTFYWNQSLVKAADTWKSIQTGITDIGYCVIGFGDPDLHVLNSFTGLPFIGWKDMQMATEVYHQVIPRFPQLAAEFKGTRLLWICSMPPNQIHTVSKEVRLPADLRGLKIITQGRLAEIAANAGAKPISSVGPPDWEVLLKTGLADGIMVHWPAISGYGLIPLFNYHTDFGDGGISVGMHGMWANEAVWNSLPADIQEIILDNSSWIEQRYIAIDEAEIVGAIAEAERLGHSFSHLGEEEIEAWRKTAAPIIMKWLETVEGRGLPARALYQEAVRLIQDYKETGER